jgi:hypothetical protein
LALRLTIDRFEGDKKQIAVLLTEDGETLNVPRKLLPSGVKAGEVLVVRIERDAAATREVARQTRLVEDELDRRDPGGDLSL